MTYESLIEDTEIIQGDSSDIYELGESTGSVLDSNWEASYTIIESFGTSPLVERALPKDSELLNFVFQIYDSESALLTANKKYIVSVQIKNATLNYTREIAQFRLRVLPQGVL